MRELIMIRYYACVIYCTLELSRSIYKRLFIRYECWTVGLGSHQVTYCAAAGGECWTVTFRNKKNKGFYSLIHGTMIKILYCSIRSIYYLNAALVHSRANPHSGLDDLLHGNLSAATPRPAARCYISDKTFID